MQRDDITIVDIALACRDIVAYVAGRDETAFRADGLTQAAVLYRIAVIGEATKRLSREFRSLHSSVPWREIAGMRDHVIHGYDDIDLEEVWRVATEDAPRLLAYVEPLLPPDDPADD